VIEDWRTITRAKIKQIGVVQTELECLALRKAHDPASKEQVGEVVERAPDNATLIKMWLLTCLQCSGS
jgi:hypothetical protein